MPNRYSGMYDDYVRKIAANNPQPTIDEQWKAEQVRKGMQSLGNMANVAAPIAGAVIGGMIPGAGIEGAKIGGQLGAGAGQALGQAAYNQGENAEDPIRKRMMERQALMQAIAGMRR